MRKREYREQGSKDKGMEAGKWEGTLGVMDRAARLRTEKRAKEGQSDRWAAARRGEASGQLSELFPGCGGNH